MQKHRFCRDVCPLCWLLAVTGSLLPSQCEAINLLVYNNIDAGAGSLRQALQDNAGLGGGNTIVFSNTITGTITLGSELSITADVTILGPSAKTLTVSGNNNNRIFDIVNATVSISGLTIANGRLSDGSVGAGIQSVAFLTVRDCVFSNNVNTFPNIGGAIYSHSGTLTILNSIFMNNSASGGAAIYTSSQTLVSNCTFTANAASNRGGAIWGSSGNGVRIYSSTIVSNSATLFGGGVYRDNLTYVRNSIIARNTAPTDPDASGLFTSEGYNLIGNVGNSSGWIGVGDQLGSAGSPLNPLLGPLQDNGGPTLTMSPLPGSPAIDQGKTAAGAIDQRGRPRPIDYPTLLNATNGDGSDIGAVEVSPDSPPLKIQLAGADVVLSWSTNATDFRLQSVTNLTASNNWTAVGGTPTMVGGQWHVTNAVSAANKFYRLIFP